MSTGAQLALEYHGLVAGGQACPCLTLGAKLFKLGSDNRSTRNLSSRRGHAPLAPSHRYCGVQFDVSMSRELIGRHFLGVTWAELTIELHGDALVCDAHPRNESDIHHLRVRYQHGVRRGRDGKLSFKLGWRAVDTGGADGAARGSIGDHLSDEYTVLWETEAPLENTYCLFTGGGTAKPTWKFQRRFSQLILQGGREVSLIIETPSTRVEPIPIAARLRGQFVRVRENDPHLCANGDLSPFMPLTRVWCSPILTWRDKRLRQQEPTLEFTL